MYSGDPEEKFYEIAHETCLLYKLVVYIREKEENKLNGICCDKIILLFI